MKNIKKQGNVKKEYFTIGQMAKLFHINIRTLRYYALIGLLEPEYVDHSSNYRYYATSQFEQLNTIKYLRALGVSIEKIEDFLKEKDTSKILALLKEQKTEVLNKKLELERIEKKIEHRILQLETAMEMPLEHIVIKNLPKRNILLMNKTFTYEDDFELLIRELCQKPGFEDAVFLGKIGVCIAKEDLILHKFHPFSSIFLILEDGDGELISKPKEWISSKKSFKKGPYATIQYKGTHDKAKKYYEKLLSYLQENHYNIAGDSVEITIIDSGITNDKEQYITELQIPFTQLKRQTCDL